MPLRFFHLKKKWMVAGKILDTVNALCWNNGLLLREATVNYATLAAAQNSNMSSKDEVDQELHYS